MTHHNLSKHTTITPDWSDLFAEYRGLIHGLIYRRTHDPVPATEVGLIAAAIDSRMHCLTSEQALVKRLRYLNGYEFQEIAETMCRSKGAVKDLQHRGQAALHKILTLERAI